jgi:sacsin
MPDLVFLCRIGFNSCYHLTDVPSFVSGSNLVYFDPHCSNLPVNASDPGLKCDFTVSMLQQYPDQCQPFMAFGCNMKDAYPGTLFRLPLRTPQMAQQSNLSKQVYSRD